MFDFRKKILKNAILRNLFLLLLFGLFFKLIGGKFSIVFIWFFIGSTLFWLAGCKAAAHMIRVFESTPKKYLKDLKEPKYLKTANVFMKWLNHIMWRIAALYFILIFGSDTAYNLAYAHAPDWQGVLLILSAIFGIIMGEIINRDIHWPKAQKNKLSEIEETDESVN